MFPWPEYRSIAPIHLLDDMDSADRTALQACTDALIPRGLRPRVSSDTDQEKIEPHTGQGVGPWRDGEAQLIVYPNCPGARRVGLSGRYLAPRAALQAEPMLVIVIGPTQHCMEVNRPKQ